MTVETCFSRARAFDEIEDDASNEEEQIYYNGLAMTFSRTAGVLADQLGKRFGLDVRQKRLFRRCLETIEEIYKGTCAVDNVYEDVHQVWNTDLRPYWMFREIFSKKVPLRCIKEATTAMTSTLEGIMKRPSHPRIDSVQQTYTLLMRMSDYCLVRSS